MNVDWQWIPTVLAIVWSAGYVLWSFTRGWGTAAGGSTHGCAGCSRGCHSPDPSASGATLVSLGDSRQRPSE